MKSRELTLSSGTKIFLGKDAENNDELVKEFKGKENIILHTEKPGSPFCVIEKLNPLEKEIKEAAIICAAKSQDWRDNKSDVFLHQFSGKDVKKTIFSKKGSWKLTNKPKLIKAKKKDIKLWWEKYN
jgi:predicted ribosome quality control (RQC) complex YloA/Tae2 family protein